MPPKEIMNYKTNGPRRPKLSLPCCRTNDASTVVRPQYDAVPLSATTGTLSGRALRQVVAEMLG